MNAHYELYRLIATSIFDGVAEIKHVDFDFGQLKKDGEELQMDYPALLIRFENIYWKDYDGTKQIGVVHVRLKIIYPYVNEGEFYETDHGVRYEAETFFTIIQNIHNIVKDLPPGLNSNIVRFNENHLENIPKEAKWVYCIDYYTNIFSDNSSFDTGMPLSVDYEMLYKDSYVLERAIEGKKVG